MQIIFYVFNVIKMYVRLIKSNFDIKFTSEDFMGVFELVLEHFHPNLPGFETFHTI